MPISSRPDMFSFEFPSEDDERRSEREPEWGFGEREENREKETL
jgi:hypothetical protein